MQTGNGRTGTLYAYEQFGIRPDVVTTAKGLAGGLPLGATMFFEKCEQRCGAGDHGSTFGGNPVACAGACSILRAHRQGPVARSAGQERLSASPISPACRTCSGVTGLGLMIGLDDEKPAREMAETCLERGLIVLTAKNKVRLLPPLHVRKDEMDFALQILNEVISE